MDCKGVISQKASCVRYGGDTLKIDWHEFLNTPEEQHAFLEGFLEVFTFFWHKPIPWEYYKRVILQEHHYYRLGKVIGVILLGIIIAGIGYLVLR